MVLVLKVVGLDTAGPSEQEEWSQIQHTNTMSMAIGHLLLTPSI